MTHYLLFAVITCLTLFSHDGSNGIRILDKKAARSRIGAQKNDPLDFTCVFRSYVYAETHLNEYQKMANNGDLNIESLTKNINNAMPEDILSTTFLGPEGKQLG